MPLKTMRSGPGRLPLRLTPEGGEAGRTRRRIAWAPWRAWYATERWRALRLEVLARDLWRCQWPGCGVTLKGGRDHDRAAVVDHVRPHRGDEALFWDVSNLQALCKRCHDGAKQRAEAAGGG